MQLKQAIERRYKDKTADEIAALLREEGIKGRRSHGSRAPEALLLERDVGAVVCAHLDRIHTLKGWEDGRYSLVIHDRKEYAGLREFQKQFDDGERPELDETIEANDGDQRAGDGSAEENAQAD